MVRVLWMSVALLLAAMLPAAPQVRSPASDNDNTIAIEPGDQPNQPNQPNKSGSGVAALPGIPPAPVAQRAVLYEEEPAVPAGKTFVGSVVWRTERAPDRQGAPGELAVRADAEIPDRKLAIVVSLRRDTESA